MAMKLTEKLITVKIEKKIDYHTMAFLFFIFFIFIFYFF